MDKARVKNLLVSTKAKHLLSEGYMGTGVTAKDRYCRKCGQELRPEDRFCGGCGKPVHATVHVPTPEADVPVPPPPRQVDAIPQQPQATEQAAPSPQPQQRVPWKGGYAKGPILLFLGSAIVTSLLDAAVTQAGSIAYVMGYAVGNFLALLLAYVPIWLILGGLVYLVARLLGKKPTYFQVVFDWWVTLAVVVPIILSGFLGGFLRGLLGL